MDSDFSSSRHRQRRQDPAGRWGMTSLPRLYISGVMGHGVCWCYDRLHMIDLPLCNVSERDVGCTTTLPATTALPRPLPLALPPPYHYLTPNITIPLPLGTYYILPLTCHYHQYHCQGQLQDFLLGGANLVRGPCLGYPEIEYSSGVAHYFLEGAQIHLQKKKQLKYAAWRPLFCPGGPWRAVTWALIRLAGPWYVLLGPDSSRGALIRFTGSWFVHRGLICSSGPDSFRGALIRSVGP